jgi:hypothetical protein
MSDVADLGLLLIGKSPTLPISSKSYTEVTDHLPRWWPNAFVHSPNKSIGRASRKLEISQSSLHL